MNLNIPNHSKKNFFQWIPNFFPTFKLCIDVLWYMYNWYNHKSRKNNYEEGVCDRYQKKMEEGKEIQ